MAKMERGKIKKWFGDKDNGVVSIGGYKGDVFLHVGKFSDKTTRLNQLAEGLGIECEVVKTKKGYECINATLLEEIRCYVPKDTLKEWYSSLGNFDNFSLLLNKFPAFKERKESVKIEINKSFRLALEKGNKKNYTSAKDCYLKRINRISNSLQNSGYEIKKNQYRLDWRLAIGLGEASVYETSIVLHHVYGYPYIPASAFKGAIRSWVVNNYFKGNETVACKDDLFSYVFGRPKTEKVDEQKGNVIFFDVNPASVPAIEIDIINTHYSDYYREGMEESWPGDYSNPNLVNFLTVKNTKFDFYYAYERDIDLDQLKNTKFDKDLCKQINAWLEEAFNYQGLGAKTSVGYGYLSNITY